MDELPGDSAQSGPWLTDDQQRVWRHVVQLFMMLPAAIESDLQRSAGLSLYDYLVLAALSESSEHALQMSELARSANSSLSRLSHLIARMAKRGLVTKRPSAHHPRASIVELSHLGEATIGKAAPLHAQLVQDLVIKPLSAGELEHLGRATAAIVCAILTAHHDDSAQHHDTVRTQ